MQYCYDALGQSSLPHGDATLRDHESVIYGPLLIQGRFFPFALLFKECTWRGTKLRVVSLITIEEGLVEFFMRLRSVPQSSKS